MEWRKTIDFSRRCDQSNETKSTECKISAFFQIFVNIIENE